MKCLGKTVLVVVFVMCLAADDATPVKSAAARAALDKRATAAKKAARECTDKLSAADTQLAEDLDRAMQQSMRDGKLETANQITDLKKQAIERAANEQISISGGGTPPDWFDGRWHVRRSVDAATYIISDNQVQVIQEDNVTTDTAKILSNSDGVLLAKYNNGWVERFTRMGDRIAFESWDPGAVKDAPNAPWTGVGVGVRFSSR